ncbi:hypothetical protein NL676_014757 [Syzygium grande]|nr:hypothetical protein NL676_014757 [Syzygium grande]
MPWSMITLLLLGLGLFHGTRAARRESLPSAQVVGTVHCAPCFNRGFSRISRFISGASVLLECTDLGFRKEVTTDERGNFEVRLPPLTSEDAKKIQGCTVKLIKSSNPGCDAVSSRLHAPGTTELMCPKTDPERYRRIQFQERLDKSGINDVATLFLFPSPSIAASPATAASPAVTTISFPTIAAATNSLAITTAIYFTATSVPFPSPSGAATPAVATILFPTNTRSYYAAAIGLFPVPSIAAATNSFAITTAFCFTATFFPFPPPPLPPHLPMRSFPLPPIPAFTPPPPTLSPHF